MDGNEGFIYRVVSILFAAPLFALYLHILLIFELNGYVSPTLGIIWTFIIGLLFVSVFPIIPVIFSVYSKETDMFVSDKEKRPKFFAWAIAIYVIGSIIFISFGAKKAAIFTICYATVSISIALLNYITKVSVHVSGVSGPLTYIVWYLGLPWLVTFVLVIPVALERIKSKSHTLNQVALGFIISVIVTLATIYVFEALM
ncbi:MAG: hypothetical protein ACP6IP_00910 [Candidatus Njordarchaeia archaeon]